MGSYIINFSVYTMAMVGVIMLALFVFKFCMGFTPSKKNSTLKVLETMKLSPKKTLYVIKAEGEKYLIAGDIDNTSLIAKLSDTQDTTQVLKTQKFSTIAENVSKREDKSMKLSSLDGVVSLKDFSDKINFAEKKVAKRPVMRQLAAKLKEV